MGAYVTRTDPKTGKPRQYYKADDGKLYNNYRAAEKVNMSPLARITRWAGDALRANTAKAATPEPIPAYGPGGKSDGSGQWQAQQNPPPLVEPRRQAVADTLSYAEGTWDKESQQPDYTMRYGDRPGQGSLDTSKPHPLDVRRSIYGSNTASNASGAYQFLDHTWAEMNNGENAPMTPYNQNAAVTNLIESTGYNYDQPFGDQTPKLSGRWASIPNEHGVSDYGQPTPHSREELDAFHQEQLRKRQEEYRSAGYAMR